MSLHWILACSSIDESSSSIHNVLSNRIGKQLANHVSEFKVPNDLRFGSFDILIKLVDDLSKNDNFVDGILRRVERQIQDIAGDKDLPALYKITSLRKTYSFTEYILNFQWDDSKYPRNRQITDNLNQIISNVQKYDDEIKHKTLHYTDIKQTGNAILKSEDSATSFSQRDFVSLITPEYSNLFKLNTEHLSTGLVVVPRGLEKEWQNKYETFHEFIVPRSSVQLTGVGVDKDGNSLWTLSYFTKHFNDIKGILREARFNLREFSFDSSKFEKFLQNKEKVADEVRKSETILLRLCQSAFSDITVAWMHLKAIRTFVESVLRFGVPANFASFIICPVTSASKQQKLRDVLSDVFQSSGLFGHSYLSAGKESSSEQQQQATGLMIDADSSNEYYPYVSLSFTTCITAQ